MRWTWGAWPASVCQWCSQPRELPNLGCTCFYEILCLQRKTGSETTGGDFCWKPRPDKILCPDLDKKKYRIAWNIAGTFLSQFRKQATVATREWPQQHSTKSFWRIRVIRGLPGRHWHIHSRFVSRVCWHLVAQPRAIRHLRACGWKLLVKPPRHHRAETLLTLGTELLMARFTSSWWCPSFVLMNFESALPRIWSTALVSWKITKPKPESHLVPKLSQTWSPMIHHAPQLAPAPRWLWVVWVTFDLVTSLKRLSSKWLWRLWLGALPPTEFQAAPKPFWLGPQVHWAHQVATKVENGRLNCASLLWIL